MSAPAFAWALERGATLHLLAADRLVLLYLADMANGERVCWPSQETIVKYTGLTLRTVRTAIHRLDNAQLIRVEAKDGCISKYHILRDTPANGNGVTPANKHHVTPANQHGASRPTPANGTYPPRAHLHGTPVPFSQTPANQHPDPSYTQVSDPRARAHAREEGKILSSRNGSGTPKPALTLVATSACEQQTTTETQPVADAEMAAKLAGLAAQTARGFRTNYPPRVSPLTPNEHCDLLTKPPPWQAKPISPEQLAAMRRIAQIQTVRVDA